MHIYAECDYIFSREIKMESGCWGGASLTIKADTHNTSRYRPGFVESTKKYIWRTKLGGGSSMTWMTDNLQRTRNSNLARNTKQNINRAGDFKNA